MGKIIKVTFVTWQDFAYNIFVEPEMWAYLWDEPNEWWHYYWQGRN